MTTFREALSAGQVLVLDGAFGTQLASRGGGGVPLAALETPALVKSIHADYAAAGANIVLANTFAANPISLAHHGAAEKFEELNTAALRLCREAVGSGCYVAGDIGPTGQLMEPYGDCSEQRVLDCYVEQAQVLASAGADLIIVETMTDVNEAAIAVRAAKSVTDLPVVASVSFDPGARGYRTVFGQDTAQAATALADAGADAVGSNCGTIDPVQMSEVIAEIKKTTSLPLCAEPNAGKPELAAGEVVFKLAPEDFAEGALKCIEAGALLIGGCCGTTPAHIAALSARLR